MSNSAELDVVKSANGLEKPAKPLMTNCLSGSIAQLSECHRIGCGRADKVL